MRKSGRDQQDLYEDEINSLKRELKKELATLSEFKLSLAKANTLNQEQSQHLAEAKKENENLHKVLRE